MSEESKTSDTDYVHMNDGRGTGTGGAASAHLGLDDPGLSQEDRDLRLAIALQKQENAAAYDAHKRSHDANVAATQNRTSRSNVHSRLAQVRAKDHGMLTVPDAYTTENAYKKGDSAYVGPSDGAAAVATAAAAGALPQEVADLKLALDLQKVEQTGVGTAHAMTKILKEEKEEKEANEMRTARSGTQAFHRTKKKAT